MEKGTYPNLLMLLAICLQSLPGYLEHLEHVEYLEYLEPVILGMTGIPGPRALSQFLR